MAHFDDLPLQDIQIFHSYVESPCITKLPNEAMFIHPGFTFSCKFLRGDCIRDSPAEIETHQTLQQTLYMFFSAEYSIGYRFLPRLTGWCL
jgi:hypothetical protein